MNDESFNESSEHEREVAREEHEREGDAETGQRSSYAREVEAEQRGETAEQLDDQGDDEAAPVDSAYRPRTG